MTQIQVLICLRCFSKYCPLLGWRSLQNRTEKAGIKIHKQVFDEIDLSIEAVDSAGWSRWFLHSEEIYWFKDSRDSLFDLPLSFFCFVLILTPTDHFKKKQRQKKKVWHCRCCWVDWDGDWNNHRDVAKSSCFLLRSILVFFTVSPPPRPQFGLRSQATRWWRDCAWREDNQQYRSLDRSSSIFYSLCVTVRHWCLSSHYHKGYRDWKSVVFLFVFLLVAQMSCT